MQAGSPSQARLPCPGQRGSLCRCREVQGPVPSQRGSLDLQTEPSGLPGNISTTEIPPQCWRTCGSHLYESTPLALVGLRTMMVHFQEDISDYKASSGLCEAFYVDFFFFFFHQPPSTLRSPYTFTVNRDQPRLTKGDQQMVLINSVLKRKDLRVMRRRFTQTQSHLQQPRGSWLCCCSKPCLLPLGICSFLCSMKPFRSTRGKIYILFYLFLAL